MTQVQISEHMENTNTAARWEVETGESQPQTKKRPMSTTRKAGTSTPGYPKTPIANNRKARTNSQSYPLTSTEEPQRALLSQRHFVCKYVCVRVWRDGHWPHWLLPQRTEFNSQHLHGSNYILLSEINI